MLIGVDASRAARGMRTGTEAYSIHLIRALIATVSEHRFRLYTPIPLPADIWSTLPPQQAIAAEVEAPRRPLPSIVDIQSADSRLQTQVIPFPRLWTHLRLAWEVRRSPPDVLFVPAHVMPLVCPVPTVVTVHDLGYLHHPESHRSFDRWYLDWTTRRHARLAAHIIADSQATRTDLIRHCDASPERITVVYPGCDESLKRVEDPTTIAAARARNGIDGCTHEARCGYLLYLGTLQPRKNLVRLVEAFARLEPSKRKLKLVLAGKRGWQYDDLFARVRSLGLQDQVVFTGYVVDSDKAALLSGAIALVYPSLYEGFGLPVLEAMACGTPVLTSDVSSLPEVAGSAALLVNPLDTDAIAQGICRLLEDAPLRQSLIEMGYEQVRRFSWASAAQQVLQVLVSVVCRPNNC